MFKPHSIKLTTLFVLALTACKSGSGPGSGSELASVNLKLPSELNIGTDYDEVQVKTELKKTDGSFESWLTSKDWTNLTAEKNDRLLDDPVTLAPGTYKINVVYLKASAAIASGSESKTECLISEFVLKAGPNTVTILSCQGEPQPFSKKDPSTSADVSIESKVISGTTTVDKAAADKVTADKVAADKAAADTVAADKATADKAALEKAAADAKSAGEKATALAQAATYPNCPTGTAADATSPKWSWINDKAVCESAKASKDQFATTQGCSCLILPSK